MNQYYVAVGILSPLSLCQKMVNLKFFFIDVNGCSILRPDNFDRPFLLLIPIVNDL